MVNHKQKTSYGLAGGLKTTIPVDELKLWDRNPRKIEKTDFERLKRQIIKFGQYKPLLVNQDNVILGGNMRLRAYRELGIERAWISRVETKNEKEMLEYALSDNDRAGMYDEEILAELVLAAPDLEMEDFKVDMGKMTGLEALVDKFQPSDTDLDDGSRTRVVVCPECGHDFEVLAWQS